MSSVITIEPQSFSRCEQNRAAAALLIGTIFWGCGFTWAKTGGDAINAFAMGNNWSHGSRAIGPILLLGVRFMLAGALWMALFPAARRGWNRASAMRALLIGGLLAIGMLVQHLGLDLTSAAISAFLTSLTIVFVPLLSMLALRRPPKLIAWIAVTVATAGVWIMTGATASGFGWGELLGLAGALDFSFYILSVNALVVKDDPFRMAGGQFLVAGLISLAIVPFIPAGPHLLSPRAIVETFMLRDVWLNCALLVIFPTLIAYGLLTVYQPKVDATRAALIYLIEPVFASIYAWIIIGAGLTGREILGAAMILLANALVEIIEMWNRQTPQPADLAPREPV